MHSRIHASMHPCFLVLSTRVNSYSRMLVRTSPVQACTSTLNAPFRAYCTNNKGKQAFPQILVSPSAISSTAVKRHYSFLSKSNSLRSILLKLAQVHHVQGEPCSSRPTIMAAYFLNFPTAKSSFFLVMLGSCVITYLLVCKTQKQKAKPR